MTNDTKGMDIFEIGAKSLDLKETLNRCGAVNSFAGVLRSIKPDSTAMVWMKGKRVRPLGLSRSRRLLDYFYTETLPVDPRRPLLGRNYTETPTGIKSCSWQVVYSRIPRLRQHDLYP